jgi:hypothetical protein
MLINVYWACLEKEWMLAKEPENVLKKFYESDFFKNKNVSKDTNMHMCPAFNSSLKNVYAIKSIYDYEFSVNKNDIFTNQYDQNFLNDHVYPRDFESKMFSFKHAFIFFTESDSLPTSFYQFPVFEDNEITKRCMIIPGNFDIGKWYRAGEFAFYLKKDFDTFKVSQNDVMYYIKFHTDEKINFLQFRNTEKLSSYQNDLFYLNGKIKGKVNMKKFYSSMKIKNMILKEIKKNLV